MSPELVDRDTEHLRILSVFQYAAAGVTGIVGLFPLIHVFIGAMVLLMPEAMRGSGKDALPREFGLVFMGLGGAFILGAWTIAAAHFLTARFLMQKRHFWFCVVASAVTCFACMFSSGIVGIGSLVILLRPGVKNLFDQAQASMEVRKEP